MQPTKLQQLEKQSADLNVRMKSVEIGFESFRSLEMKFDKMIDELHKIAIEITKNTLSNTENSKASLVLSRKYDKVQDQTMTNTNDIAAIKPIIDNVQYFGRAIIFAAFSMIALSVSIMGYVYSVVNTVT